VNVDDEPGRKGAPIPTDQLARAQAAVRKVHDLIGDVQKSVDAAANLPRYEAQRLLNRVADNLETAELYLEKCVKYLISGVAHGP
jgi:hypothetical protein